MKVGDPTKGNPSVLCPSFSWEISGRELLDAARLRGELPGVDMFLGFERMSDQAPPREVAGQFEVAALNGPHGHRPALFIDFQGSAAYCHSHLLHSVL